ncbi:MAG: hypothetical protein ABIC04_02255 [Nanoarchaeota archaeon]
MEYRLKGLIGGLVVVITGLIMVSANLTIPVRITPFFVQGVVLTIVGTYSAMLYNKAGLRFWNCCLLCALMIIGSFLKLIGMNISLLLILATWAVVAIIGSQRKKYEEHSSLSGPQMRFLIVGGMLISAYSLTAAMIGHQAYKGFFVGFLLFVWSVKFYKCEQLRRIIIETVVAACVAGAMGYYTLPKLPYLPAAIMLGSLFITMPVIKRMQEFYEDVDYGKLLSN